MHDILMTAAYTFIVLAGVAICTFWLAGAYVRTSDMQREESDFAARMRTATEAELAADMAEYGATEGNDGRSV